MAVFEHLPADTKREGEVKFFGGKVFGKLKIESGNLGGGGRLTCHQSDALKAAYKNWESGY